jgi:3-hydroxyacyl-CoA dehydrogenase
LFDLPAKTDVRVGIVLKAIKNLTKLRSGPLADKSRLPAKYHSGELRSTSRCSMRCDLVIEAITERIDWRRDLYAKIAPHLKRTRSSPVIPRVSASNALADVLPGTFA